jgi:hypothetical protein
LNPSIIFFHYRTSLCAYGGDVIDQEVARLRVYDSNISRYRRLLETNLSDFERRYLEERLSEEKSAADSLRHPASIRSWAQRPFEAGALLAAYKALLPWR